MLMRNIVEYFDDKHEEFESENTKCSKVKNFMLYVAEGFIDSLIITAPFLFMRVVIDNKLIEQMNEIKLK